MPTIPDYNQWATEEAGLTRAKRRVIKNMESGIVKMTEKPARDLTNGQADVIANQLITQFEDLTALFRQIVAFFGSGEGGEIYLDQPSDGVKAMSVVIMSAKLVARIFRSTKALVPLMRYMDLGILSDLKAVQEECHQSALEAFSTIRQITFDDNLDLNDVVPQEDMNDLESFVDSYDPNEPSLNEPDEDYSIQVKDKNGSVVYTSLNGNSFPGSAGNLFENATGDGVTTVFAVSFKPSLVYINGVYQNQNTYTIAIGNVTFSAAPPLTSVIEFLF